MINVSMQVNERTNRCNWDSSGDMGRLSRGPGPVWPRVEELVGGSQVEEERTGGPKTGTV